MQLYLNIVRNSTLRYLCGLKKKKKQLKLFSCYVGISPAFTFNFELGLPCVSYIVLNVFRLDVMNLGNIQASFKDSPNINMKFLPRALPLHQRLPGLQLPFNFRFAKNNMLKLSPGTPLLPKVLFKFVN